MESDVSSTHKFSSKVGWEIFLAYGAEGGGIEVYRSLEPIKQKKYLKISNGITINKDDEEEWIQKEIMFDDLDECLLFTKKHDWTYLLPEYIHPDLYRVILRRLLSSVDPLNNHSNLPPAWNHLSSWYSLVRNNQDTDVLKYCTLLQRKKESRQYKYRKINSNFSEHDLRDCKLNSVH